MFFYCLLRHKEDEDVGHGLAIRCSERNGCGEAEIADLDPVEILDPGMGNGYPLAQGG